LADFYNTQVAATVPHCYPVSPAEFAAGRYEKTSDACRPMLHAERVIVGIVRGQVRGFAHVSVGEIVHRERRLSGGFIHFMTYARGHRDVGQAILAACERHFCDTSVSTIRAFDGYFYRFCHLGFPLVSDRMGHVYGLFGLNGYKLSGEGEIFFRYPHYPVARPILPDPAVEVLAQVDEGRGKLPNVTIRALRDGNEIGICVALSGGDFCRARQAQDTAFMDGLYVVEAERGRGWGRYLLMRTLCEARRLGYQHTVISTDQQNYRAQLFYTNFGYRVTDTVYRFIRTGVADEAARRLTTVVEA
jgi:ribosomal protein S18 acetylase RimI-like enzyme